MLNDVKVIICGKEYKLKTAESPNYVFALARNLEAKINEIIENARKNITDYKVTEMSEKDFAKEWVKLENCRN